MEQPLKNKNEYAIINRIERINKELIKREGFINKIEKGKIEINIKGKGLRISITQFIEDIG